MRSRFSVGAIVAIATLLLAVLVMDIGTMLGQIQQQTRDAGISQLETINREFEASISDAEHLTMQVALEAREVLDDREALKSFLRERKKVIVEGNTGAFNVYAADSDWFYIPDFDAPEDYIAQERTWYKGAIRNGGAVCLSSPYQDVVTGDICYTVSVMLGDGETVVAIDYTMDTIKAYVQQIHGKGIRNVAIVTDDGIIAGCSEEGLVGERLVASLPEFVGIWSLSKSTEEVATARIRSGVTYENLFGLKSRDGWILIVSVNDWELYHASYTQLFVTVLLLVALVVTIALAFFFAWKNQKKLQEEELERKRQRESKRRAEGRRITKQYRNRILAFMALVMAFGLYAMVSATYNWGNAQMRSEMVKCEYKLSKWIDTQKSILDMFVSTISVNPDMLQDYDATIRYLDEITSQYPEISVSYLSNSDLDPAVYMNNGWKPDPSLVVEERPWYIGALESETGWFMTTPYYDAQTGRYCVTLSEQVLDARTGDFLGVFGIDFYMDKLVEIMGDSYTGDTYAFLVDTEGYIVNHPYGKYQMSEDSQTSVLQLAYGTVRTDEQNARIIKDYDGTFKVLLATENETSHLSVYLVAPLSLVYGRVVVYSAICLAAFLVCIVTVYRLLSRMIAWQEEVNRRLEKAAQTDAMTGLLNKASAEEEIALAVKQKTGAFFVIDLDSFKLVNDLYGHEMGDRVLVRFAELIRQATREDDISGRIGGDEFVMFCEGLTDELAIMKKHAYLNEEIMKSARELMGEDMGIPLGCSIGAALVPQAGREYGRLFAMADLALHNVKMSRKHDVRICSAEKSEQHDQGDNSLSNLRMIFGERNVKETALVADRELFQAVYRSMVRLSTFNGWELHLVEFTLHTEGERELSAYADSFVELSAGLLRNCDVVLKYNDRQVLFLLMHSRRGGYTVPVKRVMDAWEREGKPEVSISYQQERVV